MDQRPSGNLLPGANMTIGFVFQANPNLGIFYALFVLLSHLPLRGLPLLNSNLKASEGRAISFKYFQGRDTPWHPISLKVLTRWASGYKWSDMGLLYLMPKHKNIHLSERVPRENCVVFFLSAHFFLFLDAGVLFIDSRMIFIPLEKNMFRCWIPWSNSYDHTQWVMNCS